jgi:guanylate kinase
MSQILYILLGESGSGKDWFYENVLTPVGVKNLVSATTRGKRDGEEEGVQYYFRDENYFANPDDFATHLWPNKAQWMQDNSVPKWLYGLETKEIKKHSNAGHNMAYNVIEPRYALELLNYFTTADLHKTYKFVLLYFKKPGNNLEIAAGRANMKNDVEVRKNNTCNLSDFKALKLTPDYQIESSAKRGLSIKRFPVKWWQRKINIEKFLNNIQK